MEPAVIRGFRELYGSWENHLRRRRIRRIGPGSLGQVHPLKHDLAFGDLVTCIAGVRRRLAAAGLAHNTQRLALPTRSDVIRRPSRRPHAREIPRELTGKYIFRLLTSRRYSPVYCSVPCPVTSTSVCVISCRSLLSRRTPASRPPSMPYVGPSFHPPVQTVGTLPRTDRWRTGTAGGKSIHPEDS